MVSPACGHLSLKELLAVGVAVGYGHVPPPT